MENPNDDGLISRQIESLVGTLVQLTDAIEKGRGVTVAQKLEVHRDDLIASLVEMGRQATESKPQTDQAATDLEQTNGDEVIAAIAAKVEELRPFVEMVAEWPIDDAASSRDETWQMSGVVADLNKFSSVLTEEIARSASMYAICVGL